MNERDKQTVNGWLNNSTDRVSIDGGPAITISSIVSVLLLNYAGSLDDLTSAARRLDQKKNL